MLQKDIVKGIVDIGLGIFQLMVPGFADIHLAEIFKEQVFQYLIWRNGENQAQAIF